MFQFEVDVEDYPDLSSASELIGTALYHAIGYHVVDSYIVNVDPDRISIAPDATMKDASGRRRYRRGDLDDVLKAAARNPDGTYRMSAGRFVEGAPLGNFRHFGTRPDDPNDIHPHEHRRELRANRVFGAWLNHDDSRALNTLDMLVPEGNHKAIRHYMFDFGSLLGNTPDRRGSGSEYLIEKRSTRNTMLSFGLWVPPWQFVDYPGDLRPMSACSTAIASSPASGSPNTRIPPSTTCALTMRSGRRESFRGSATRRSVPWSRRRDTGMHARRSTSRRRSSSGATRSSGTG